MSVTMREFMSKAPQWLQDALQGMSRWQNIEWTKFWDSDDDVTDVKGAAADGRRRAVRLEGAEAVGSSLGACSGSPVDPDEGEHIVALDIDHNAVLIPSSTDGHYHLVVDHTCTWGDYKEFLRAAAKIGLISNAYAELSVERGETFLRLPWIRKGNETHDASAALISYLTETDVDGEDVRDTVNQQVWAEAEPVF